jgi:hypothetical protein
MEEHGITADDLEWNRTQFGTTESSQRYKAMPTWYSVLAMGVAIYHECHAVTAHGRIKFKGFDKDAIVAPLTLDYLIQTMERGVKRYQKENPCNRDDQWYYGVTPRMQGSSYRSGYASQMQQIMFTIAAERKKAQEQDIQESGGTALVVQKAELVDGEFGKMTTSRCKMAGKDGGAKNAGRDGARNTGLNSQVTGAGQRQLA